MCGALIPAILGVAALGLLGGGVGGNSCGTASVTIPQESGEFTHGITAGPGYGYQQQQFAYAAPQQAYAQPAYATQPAPVFNSAPGYAATQGYYGPPSQPAYGAAEPAGYGYPVDSTVGGSLGYNGQSVVGAGVDVDPGGVGVGANVGGINAGIGVGPHSY